MDMLVQCLQIACAVKETHLYKVCPSCPPSIDMEYLGTEWCIRILE